MLTRDGRPQPAHFHKLSASIQGAAAGYGKDEPHVGGAKAHVQLDCPPPHPAAAAGTFRQPSGFRGKAL
jgi:hypothetical protein